MGIKPVFLSSESVYDGLKGDYNEFDEAKPKFSYGAHKFIIEKYIIENFDDYLILRLSKVYDSNISGKTFVSSWINLMDDNSEIMCADNNIFAPIHLEDLCEVFKILINNDASGLYNVSSCRAFNRKEMFLKLLNYYSKFNDFGGKIVFKSLNEFPGAEYQPLNTSMNPNKLIKETGYFPKNYDEWMYKIVDNRFK